MDEHVEKYVTRYVEKINRLFITKYVPRYMKITFQIATHVIHINKCAP